MGLDMYLYRRSWVNNQEYIEPENRDEIKMTRKGKEYDTSNIKWIIEEIGYWRKANAIHKWFVDNIQKGNDDCGEYFVTLEELEKLYNICKDVLKDIEEGSTEPAEKMLPTQSGFFFGDTTYDEGYIKDLKNTINIIDKVFNDSKGTFVYSSSW